MVKPTYLESIQAKASDSHILMRMGYKKGKTILSLDEEKNLQEKIKKAHTLCELKGAYVVLKITSVNADKIHLENNITFESSGLAHLLSGCGEAVLMASTAGNNAVISRDREITSGDAVYGLIIDATASETADAGLDWIQDFLNSQLAKKGQKLTQRYSPGYGDLNLSAQKEIFNALQPSKIGITINDRHILEPEKSVFAIAGIIS